MNKSSAISTPLISIVIPTYEMKGQGVVFLDRCLQSIQKQIDLDQADIEIVISDQSNNLDIANYCIKQKALSLFPIHYHHTKTGRGIAAHNLNTGIDLATGKYIKILFQDDLLVEDEYLKVLSEIIHSHSPDVIMTNATHTKDGTQFYNTLTPQPNPYFLFGNNTVSSPSVLTVSRAVLQTIRFDEHLKLLFDCDFYYQIFHRCQSIEICNAISIANGVWEGQTQFAISPEQFTQEVRYLNWKYPSAKLAKLLPSYQQFFAQLHPSAPFPFDLKIVPSVWQGLWWKWARSQIESLAS
jgi:hypothetical protein